MGSQNFLVVPTGVHKNDLPQKKLQLSNNNIAPFGGFNGVIL